MSHRASEFAKYFLSLTDEEAGDTISNLKLQKLLYYAQGFCLALRDDKLFVDELEAWQHGPVVPRVYQEYARYGGGAIPEPESYTCDLTKSDRELLDEVFTVYGQYSAWRLREMTHDEPPWKEAWAEAQNGGSKIISENRMSEYFKTLVTA